MNCPAFEGSYLNLQGQGVLNDGSFLFWGYASDDLIESKLSYSTSRWKKIPNEKRTKIPPHALGHHVIFTLSETGSASRIELNSLDKFYHSYMVKEVGNKILAFGMYSDEPSESPIGLFSLHIEPEDLIIKNSFFEPFETKLIDAYRKSMGGTYLTYAMDGGHGYFKEFHL